MTAGNPVPEHLRRLGLGWHESGQCSLSGPLLDLAENLDRAFTDLAAPHWAAQPERHPASLPATTLQRVDYLSSFPHQATFPLQLDPDEANLAEFCADPVPGPDGRVALTRLAPATEVLTPAACYHLYAGHEGEALPGPLYLTTRNTCFRREASYTPLRRQWSFTMREIVCLGTADETGRFLDDARAAADRLLAALDLAAPWTTATDPFFRPLQNPKFLLQKLQPTKWEAVYGGDLAIASANLHHEHFGEAFGITRDGAPAHTACLAFGLERWLFAVLDRHGDRPADWPDPSLLAGSVR